MTETKSESKKEKKSSTFLNGGKAEIVHYAESAYLRDHTSWTFMASCGQL